MDAEDSFKLAETLQMIMEYLKTAMVAELPTIHRDPFDRMLVAQAISEPLRLLTSDEILKHYSELIDIV